MPMGIDPFLYFLDLPGSQSFGAAYKRSLKLFGMP